MSTIDEARAAKAAAEKAFAHLGVAGVGVTRIGDGYGVKVNLREAPHAATTLPDEIDGVPVRVDVVGRIRKADDDDASSD